MFRSHFRRGRIARPWLILSVFFIAVGGLVWALQQTTRPELVLLCAAAPLKPVQEIAAAYEKESGVKISIEPDNSGMLLSRLRAAPDKADLYLSSDESFMQTAQREHLVTEVLPVARQQVVIGVAKGNPLKVESLDDLLRDDVRVALPNVELVAVAASAARALHDVPAWKKLLERQRSGAGRISSVGTVTEAGRAVQIGAADATFVWDNTAKQFGIDAVEPPELKSADELAVLGIVAASPRTTAALRFARYLTARDRDDVFRKYGFRPVAADQTP